MYSICMVYVSYLDVPEDSVSFVIYIRHLAIFEEKFVLLVLLVSQEVIVGSITPRKP